MIIDFCSKCYKQFTTDDFNAARFIACPHCAQKTQVSPTAAHVKNTATPNLNNSNDRMNVNVRDANGRTALMIAALNDQPEKVKELIINGANVNIQDNEGYTALNYAYADHSFEPAEILIKYGADLNIKDKYGRNILFQAIDVINNPEYIDRVLIKKGADINTQNIDGTPLLHYALELALKDGANNVKVKMLLAAGVNVNVCNSSGISALNAAIILGLCDIVPLLIQHGAEINLADRNEKKLTPVMTAVIVHHETDLKNNFLLIINELAAHGADFNIISGEGMSALDYAQKFGCPDMISLLIAHGAVSSKNVFENDALYNEHEINTDGPDIEAPENPSDGNNLACLFEREGKFDSALKIYEQLNEKFPEYKNAWRNRGMLLARQKKYDDAFKCLQKAVAIDPVYIMAHMGFGLVYEAMGDHEMAVLRFEYVLKLDPYNTDAMFNKGLSLYKAGCKNEAIKAFSKVIEINPYDSEAAALLEKLSNE